MEYIKTFENHQLNAPAIDGINSSKPRKDGKPSLYNQNVDDNPMFDTDGSGDGVGGSGTPMAGDNTRPNVAVKSVRSGNTATMGIMGSTETTKTPTDDEKDGIAIPLLRYTKKGITGDQYTKVGFEHKTNDNNFNRILKFNKWILNQKR